MGVLLRRRPLQGDALDAQLARSMAAFAVAAPFVAVGIRRLNELSKDDLSMKPLVGLMAVRVGSAAVTRVTVAVALRVVSATDVAFTVTVVELGSVVGAV